MFRKITVSLLLLSLMLIFLIGCDDNSEPTKPAATKETEELNSGDKVADGDLGPFLQDFMKDYWENDITHSLANADYEGQIDVQVSNFQINIVETDGNRTVVEVTYDAEKNIPAQIIRSTPSGAEMRIAAQTLVRCYHQTFELSISNGVWQVDDAYTGTASEKLQNEFACIEGAIQNMLGAAKLTELDTDYFGVDTGEEARNVTAQNGEYNLFDHCTPYKFPYFQAYDIAKNGTVTVSSEED